MRKTRTSASLKIHNFHYDGIGGRMLAGIAPYTVKFVKWTDDPGIFEGKCSDRKTRLIPGWAVIGEGKTPPMPNYQGIGQAQRDKTGLLFHIGTPSESK